MTEYFMPGHVFAGLKKNHYRNILADPPWDFKSGKGKGSRHPCHHYETMSLQEIGDLPVHDLAHPDGARLFLWTTMPFLKEALKVMKKWRFRYSTCRVWVKTWPKAEPPWTEASFAHGPGYEVLGNPEPLIIAKIGKPEKMPTPRPKALIIDPRRQHSRKPDKVRDEIFEKLQGPHCELFARSYHRSFDTWGFEISKFDVDLAA